MKKRIIALLSISLVLISVTLAFAGWALPLQLTNDTIENLPVDLVEEDGNLHLLSVKFLNPENITLQYRKKIGTAAWGPAVNVAKTDFYGIPSMTVYQGKAHIVYAASDGNDHEIFYKTNKSGAFNVTPVRISNNALMDLLPTITQENGRLYLTYGTHFTKNEFPLGNNELFFSMNTNGKWSIPKRITSDPGIDFLASMHAVNGKLHMAWTNVSLQSTMGSTIKYRTYATGAWSAIKTLSRKNRMLALPQLSVNNGIPQMVYNIVDMNTGTALGFSYLTAGTWKNKDIGPTPAGMIDVFPQLAAKNGKIRVIWTRLNMANNFDTDVIYATLPTLTGLWTKSNLSYNTSRNEIGIGIVLDAKAKSHIIYGQMDGDTEIFYRKTL